ncbi:U-box domain-containing protein 33-like isoform X2 [Actinidia eriantha]|uniref:U-box domain-containing protein 33-like isoform X2 n=1 Tax=Actinidia eriantha TaxID=165200 RepID=UPI00258C7C0B|nr:U-box domain-containing protein 33-like isoform X2 [Actinidia eriantha]XP_057462611.1 U-box domain-containing protein 33-like isoform X2 [Actinidia eriantha]
MNFCSSSSSSGDMADDLALALVVIADAELESRQEQGSVEDHHPSSSLLQEQGTSDELYEQLEQAMAETDRRWMAEKDVIDVLPYCCCIRNSDAALKLAEELRKKQEDTLNTLMPLYFSLSEIDGATKNFDQSLKIGEGGYGNVYRGFLRHTQVAIKMLDSQSLQGPFEFQQEVNFLIKLRHPNIVNLIGTCPEAFILVYECLPSGSLEDRLSCVDNTPPLSWQTRIRIAAELCAVLIFLHSCEPDSIVHGDLKPGNILLDANYVCKLGDFGIGRAITQNELSSNDTTLCRRTDPKGTFAYIDPEFVATGELTTKSDVYSFGIILLHLLTGRPAVGLPVDVQNALANKNLEDLLDDTAGDWPFVLAEQLTCLALRCCETNRRGRPDLASDVWRVLEPMTISCGAPSFTVSPEEHRQIPSYFVCPILQDIMENPHIAADGYTYELEALRGWLDSGHDTSPMTNVQLPNLIVVLNRALRSAIQEWLQNR